MKTNGPKIMWPNGLTSWEATGRLEVRQLKGQHYPVSALNRGCGEGVLSHWENSKHPYSDPVLGLLM